MLIHLILKVIFTAAEREDIVIQLLAQCVHEWVKLVPAKPDKNRFSCVSLGCRGQTLCPPPSLVGLGVWTVGYVSRP